MSEHTQGPWKVSNRFDIYEIGKYGFSGTYIGTTCGNAELPESIKQIDEANAKLIAAAPDLLEACKLFVMAWEKSLQLEKTDIALSAAKYAIKKAEGEHE
tara:strand:+ start:24 stop:323 length:300 start_codon:yes stop_codon:yes gene_type:complete